MGVFSRINDIVQANINTMLDKAEDPQKIMRLIIQEMEETLVELRTVSAKHLAEKKQYERKQMRLQQDAATWTEKAELALSHDKEGLAKAALQQKQQCLHDLNAIAQNLQVINDNLDKLSIDAQRLHSKLAEAKAKQKALNSREVASAARLKVKQREAQYDIEHAIEKFESYERKIEDLEAQVEAFDVVSETTDLQTQFENLEKDNAIQSELAAMKANIKAKRTSTEKADKSADAA